MFRVTNFIISIVSTRVDFKFLRKDFINTIMFANASSNDFNHVTQVSLPGLFLIGFVFGLIPNRLSASKNPVAEL